MRERPPIMVPAFRRLEEYVGVWAIEPRAASALWQAAASTDLAAHAREPAPKLRSAFERIAMPNGRQVAVIKVLGTLMKQQGSLSDGTSTVQLRKDIRAAAADHDIAAILLAIDSPGGTVAGTDDLAREVQAARKRKPVWAAIEDLGASAAYWVASQAEKVFANSTTALVGSIGTMMTVADLSGMAEKEGVKVIVYATGNLKGAGTPGTAITEEQSAYFQGLVDDSQKAFDEAVKKGRGLSAKQLEAVRTGAVFSATESLDRKLIDGIQPLDATLAALAQAARKSQPSPRGDLPPAQRPEAMKMGFNEWLSARGLSVDEINEDQRVALELVFEAEQKAGKPPRPEAGTTLTVALEADVSQARQQAAAEVRRQDAIRDLCVKYGNPQLTLAGNKESLQAHAIEQGWTAERAELECLRLSRAAPAVAVRSHDRDCNLQALQGAMILRANGRLDHPSYQHRAALCIGIPAWLRQDINAEARQRAMDAAHRYADLSMLDLCREAVRLDGHDVPHARPELIRAAFSGGSLTNVFTTNVNTQVLATYMEAADTTAEWTQTTDVADFKTNERPRLVKGGSLAKLPRGGEADHTSRSDVAESYKIARYARQFQVDEQDVIDDAFNALADVPVEMGNASARLRPDLVYAIILDNPQLTATARDLFNATDGNLLTTAALAADKLRTAVKAMSLFQENGVNLDLKASHIMVPPSLRHLAAELINSATIQISWGADDETLKERGTLNAIREDNLRRVSEPRLENGVTDPSSGTTFSGSATTWYLACNKAHTIEVAYLRGTGRAPQVRSFVLSEGKWGIGWDICHDIGAKAMDWRGLVQNTA